VMDPLAPITGPIVVRGAKPGDVVAIDLIEPPSGRARAPGCCAANSRSRWQYLPRCAMAAPGSAVASRCPSTPISARFPRCRPRATSRLMPGAYGGDFDQKDAGQGSRVYLPVLVDDALVFFGDLHAAISDGIITGTG